MAIFLGAGLLPAAANNPGGFTPLVTTPVTTGTETYNGRTNRYLDNGILHVSIRTNGNVDSIKYLKPGLPGTPKANGIETVSQSGVNFGNHTAIYYYIYPDSTGDAAYTGTVATSTNIDLGFLRAYDPARHNVVADVELHYTLGKGNTGLYCYMIVKHPASFAAYGTNLNISFIQGIWPTAHDNTNFLCENQYLDDYTKYGLFIDGVQQKRNGLQPNFYDGWHTTNVPGMPAEIVQYTTGVFAGCTNGKYSYTFDYPTLDTFGMASDTNQIGLWYVAGGHEYQNNGPTACEYAGGIGGLMLFEPLIAHYQNTGLDVGSNANWTKIYGPWMLYFNGQSNGLAAWADAQNQAVAEKSAWPYAWLTNSVYQPKTQRALVSGRLVINDPLRPQANAAGAWIGLAAPDDGTENAPDNWQFQSDGYQFWTQCAADGSFTLPPVTTFSPYGGSQSYTLYAYCSGTNGSVGEFQTGPFTFAPGTVTNLGTLTWQVPHPGSQVLWEIGHPDRTAAEYRHGDEYGRPGMWLGFGDEFSSPLEYDVASNNWATALNYAHTVDYTASTPWKWHLNYNLPSVRQGTYWLNIAYAAANSYQIVRVNNDAAYVANFTPDNGNHGASTMLRQAIHTKYTVAHVPIPSSLLVPGANFITLDHEYHTDHANDCFMYDYLDLEAPMPQLTWRGDGVANLWDMGVTSNWFDGSDTVAYHDLSPVILDDTGSASPAINVVSDVQPASVLVSANKDYSLNGKSLYGSMSLIKSGTGTLTLNNTNAYTGGTIVSNGTLRVNGAVTGPLTVTGGTLGGAGSAAGDVSLLAGTVLAPGPAVGPGTLTVANTAVTNDLALTNVSLVFHLGGSPAVGGGINDLVRLDGGTLTLAGTNTVYPLLTGGLPADGTYTLITGGGATVGGGANLAWAGGTGATRQTYGLDASTPGAVLLRVTNKAGIPRLASALVWRGTNGNSWDTTTTNWLNGAAADLFYSFDPVVFNDTSTNGSVSISGTVQPGGIQVSNAARTYTFSIGAIGGNAALTKSGSGTLQMGSAGHSYAGGTVLNAGTLQVNDLAGLGGGEITLNGGLLKSAYSSGNGYGPTNDLVVPTGATAAIYTANRFAPTGRLLGGGVLNVTNASTQNRCDLKGNWSEFAGTLRIIGANGNNGVRFINQGGAFAGFGKASVYLDGVVTDPQLFSSGLVIPIGALAGTATAILKGATLGGTTNDYTTYSIGGLHFNSTFAGSVQDSSSSKVFLRKVGLGTLTLSGSNNYSGTTFINAGTLQIGNGGTSGTLGTNTISNSGTLAFNRSNAIDDSGFGLITGLGSVAQNGAGTLTFTRAQPYTGPTFVNAGTLALSGGGAIAGSAGITVSAGARFDVSGTTAGDLTLAAGQTLSGNGAVKGVLRVGDGATLAPGNPFGTLTFSNALALSDGGTTRVAVSHSPLTNSMARVFGALTNGGTLVVVQSNAAPLAAGDTFTLFSAASRQGAFASVSLPGLEPGLAWNTNNLNAAGTLAVISIVPSFTTVSRTGSEVVFGGGGGLPNGTYYVLASTNLTLPAAAWTRLATNTYDAGGYFNFTNPIPPGIPQVFYRLQVP